MGSDAELIIVDDHGRSGDLASHAVERIEQLESRWSRFRDDSEVSRLNRCPGVAVSVSTDTVRLVTIAIEAWRESGGAVNPTVLGAVLEAGYVDTFERIGEGARPDDTNMEIVACTDIVIDGTTVTLPPQTGFDPGGIGKGLAADIIVEELLADGAAGVCVNLGGDLRVSGRSPSGGGWTIAVDAPCRGLPIALLGISDGAMATSSTLRRRWSVGGEIRHHLIDPATGRPSHSDLVQVTAIARSAWIAELHAKTALLRGSTRAFDLMSDAVSAVSVDRNLQIGATPSLHRHLGDNVLPPAVA
jgi:FAD:protein FMN transferase